MTTQYITVQDVWKWPFCCCLAGFFLCSALPLYTAIWVGGLVRIRQKTMQPKLRSGCPGSFFVIVLKASG
jgi:hypothetical protein